MYEKIINKFGLSKLQAEIMDSLLVSGADKASNIAKKIKRPRGVAYKGLDELMALGLISHKEAKKGVTIFSAEHPSHLENVLAQKEKELQYHRQEFLANLPDLVSAYNLISNKPGVRFYEGDEGVEKVLDDVLTSKTEVYTFADLEAVNKYAKEINDRHVKKRAQLNIKKKVIIADTPENREYFKDTEKEITEIKFIKKEFYAFSTGMQIYDNKISYQTLTPDNKIAVLIEDRNIYQMNKLIFEYLWETL